jgi:hypothetical protein
VNDLDGYQLQRLCEGIASDKTFKIPSAIWPRFSITDNFEQQPVGDDPVVFLPDDQVSWTGDDPSLWVGDPKSWFGSRSISHFLGSEFILDDPTKYRVPFHQGSRVYINEVPQEYNVDYFVDAARSYIQFAVAPGSKDKIQVQLFKTDRLFIAFNFPFDSAVNRDYDMFAFDMLPFDSDESGLIGNDADAWNIVVDSSYPEGHWPILFYNAYPLNQAKAELKLLSLSGVNGDIWRITAIGPWSFKVQKNQTGQIWFAYFKTPFNNGQISFVIDRVWSDYYLVADSNTYNVASVDETDFLVDLSVVTEHGAVTDPIPPVHRPMEFVMKSVTKEGGFDFMGYDDYGFNEPEASFTPSFTIGRVKLITETTANGPADSYAFVLNEIPTRGTYVELQVEQNGQLNPWINTKIEDDMYMLVTWPADTVTDQLDPTDPFSQVTIPYTIPAGTSKLIHNVNLANSDAPPVPAMGSLSYTETRSVSELVLYHNLDN